MTLDHLVEVRILGGEIEKSLEKSRLFSFEQSGKNLYSPVYSPSTIFRLSSLRLEFPKEFCTADKSHLSQQQQQTPMPPVLTLPETRPIHR